MVAAIAVCAILAALWIRCSIRAAIRTAHEIAAIR